MEWRWTDATSTPPWSGQQLTSTASSTPATRAELRTPTNGTRWTNKQLLFHMLFGFVVVRVLLPLVKGFGRLPPAVSRVFAAILNAGTRPFHVLNYLSALPGGTVLDSPAMGRLMYSTIEHLRGSLDAGARAHTRTRDALPGRLGSLLQGRHDRRGRLPLPDPALRPPPAPAICRRSRTLTLTTP